MIETREDYQNAINKLRSIVRSWGKADVYLVGGCVRDDLLGELPKDIDLVVDYPKGSEEFINFLRTTYDLSVCRGFTVFPKYGTSRFELCIGRDKWIPIECVIPRTEKYESTTRKPSEVEFGSITDDAMRRDFCCNALYRNVLDDKVLDPTGHGLEDLKNNILRTPLDPEKTFLDDPLRMLRAIRFCVCIGFGISQEVYSKIKLYREFYSLSKERIQDELNKIILSPNPIDGIKMLQDRGLLIHILPELSKTWGLDQKSKYHNLNLTEHTFKVLRGVMKPKDPPRQKQLELALRFSALLHDIGKGRCQIKNSDGTCSYYQHEKKSAELASEMLKRLKYSNDFIEIVEKLILNHMCLKGNYDYQTHEYTGSPKQTRRIAGRLSGILSLEMDLIEADNLAHAPEYCMPGQVKSFWEHYKNDVILSREQDKPQKQPVSGNRIMEILGVSGKPVGDIKHLFDTWFLNDPRLSEIELFQKYEEWTDGIEIWVSREKAGGTYVVSYSEPCIEEYINSVPYGSSVVRYLPTIWKENIILEPGEKQKVQASKYPALHLALQNHVKAKDILHEIGKKLGELSSETDGFLELNLGYDCQNDLSCRIKWEDGRDELFT